MIPRNNGADQLMYPPATIVLHSLTPVVRIVPKLAAQTQIHAVQEEGQRTLQGVSDIAEAGSSAQIDIPI